MKTVTHVVQVFLDIERPSRGQYALDLNEERIKKRIGLFNKFMLPSLLNQTFQNFRAFLLCGNKYKELISKYKWNKRIDLCYGKDRVGAIPPDIDTDCVAITRLDSNSILHKDAMAHIRDSLFMETNQKHLVFREYLYWDRTNKSIYPMHQKQSSPFITHIFPKEIYQNYKELAKQPFISNRFVPESDSAGPELSSDLICIINNESEKREAERDRSLRRKADLINVLRPFSVNPEDIRGEEGAAQGMRPPPFYEKVDIIFTTHNHADMSIKALDAIKTNTRTPCRIIWIDSGSSPENYEAIKRKVDEFENLSYRFGVNRFYAKTVNQGLIMSTSRYVAVVSNDVIVTEGWLGKLTSLMEADPKIGLLSPLTDKIGSSGPRAQAAIKRFALPVNGGSAQEINLLPSRFGDYHGNISMFCAMVRQEVMEKVGLLDERFFILGNDDDYCDRVRLARYKTGMCLNCFVFHGHGVTKNAVFAPRSPECMAVKRDHQALLSEKRRIRAMTGSLD